MPVRHARLRARPASQADSCARWKRAAQVLVVVQVGRGDRIIHQLHLTAAPLLQRLVHHPFSPALMEITLLDEPRCDEF